jgi:hypothetical protein
MANSGSVASWVTDSASTVVSEISLSPGSQDEPMGVVADPGSSPSSEIEEPVATFRPPMKGKREHFRLNHRKAVAYKWGEHQPMIRYCPQ